MGPPRFGRDDARCDDEDDESERSSERDHESQPPLSLEELLRELLLDDELLLDELLRELNVWPPPGRASAGELSPNIARHEPAHASKPITRAIRIADRALMRASSAAARDGCSGLHAFLFELSYVVCSLANAAANSASVTSRGPLRSSRCFNPCSRKCSTCSARSAAGNVDGNVAPQLFILTIAPVTVTPVASTTTELPPIDNLICIISIVTSHGPTVSVIFSIACPRICFACTE